MNQIHALSEHVLAGFSLAPAARTANTNGAAIVIKGFTRATFELIWGTHDRTTGDETLDVKIQESLDGGANWVDIAGAVFPQVIAANGQVLMDINLEYRGSQLRAVGTVGGTTPSTDYAVSCFLYRGGSYPQTQTITAVKV